MRAASSKLKQPSGRKAFTADEKRFTIQEKKKKGLTLKKGNLKKGDEGEREKKKKRGNENSLVKSLTRPKRERRSAWMGVVIRRMRSGRMRGKRGGT